MAGDFNLFDIDTTEYESFINNLEAMFSSVARMAINECSNRPVNSIFFDSVIGTFQKYDGTNWSDVVFRRFNLGIGAGFYGYASFWNLVEFQVDAPRCNVAPVRSDELVNKGYVDPLISAKANLNHSHQIAHIVDLQDALNEKATFTYVDQQITALVDSSPEALNTLNEFAVALGNDPNFATTITNSIANKLEKPSVAGTNGQFLQYTNGSQVWATIQMGNVSGLVEALNSKSDTSHNHNSSYASLSHGHLISEITDLQDALNGKASASHDHMALYAPKSHTHLSYESKADLSDITFEKLSSNGDVGTASNQVAVGSHSHDEATTGTAGLMSASDKTKLNGIAGNANNYSHPTSHPASMITQDVNNRFCSDSEKSTWNGKLSGSGVTKEQLAINGDIETSITSTNDKLPTSKAVKDYVDDEAKPETGTFTPTIEGTTTAGSNTSYSIQKGRYTKTGDCVHFTIALLFTSFNGTGGVIIKGLPFTVDGSSPLVTANVWHHNYSIGSTGKMIYALPTGTVTNIDIRTLDYQGTIGLLGIAANQAGYFYISGHYYTSS
jgi:hypothetical protein